MRPALAITLVLFALVNVLVSVRYRPPAALSASAPKSDFSAERARAVQARFVGDGPTRFVGTEGNAHGRAVIADELERLGWKVETQREPSCTYSGTCATVTNVIGRLPGIEPVDRGVVLLSTHHDSVLAGPGASDDGVGVAALLEVARALSEGDRLRRTVVALFTDGEEAGLLGADAFVRSHPLAKSVRATVNVDSRGSRGPSQMFETSRGNAWLVSLVAKHVPRPVTSSIFYEVYKRMPNDTDFSITKTIAHGVNFANVAGVEFYHTPLDAMTRADPRTLQHHGDNLLAMARAFATDELEGHDVSDAVWFDVLSLGIVRWPERASMLLALVALSLLVGQTIRARSFDRGLFVFVGSIVVGALATAATGQGLAALGAFPAIWTESPWPALIALHSAATAGAIAVAFWLARRSSARSLWAGTWIGWAALAVVSAAIAPGISYLFVVPALAAAVTGLLSLEVACAVPAVVASVLLLSISTGVYEALGFALPAVVTVPSLLLATTLAPMTGTLVDTRARHLPPLLFALALVATILARFTPKFSADVPQRVNVVFRQDAERARVFVDASWGKVSWGRPPMSMLDAMGGAQGRAPALPWSMPSEYVEVPRIELPLPTVDVLSVDDDGAKRRVRAKLRSPRGATSMVVVFPHGRPLEVKVDGRFAFPREVLGIFAVPAEGTLLEVESSVSGPIEITLVDRSRGVPSGTKAEDAVQARPFEAVASQDGDVTVAVSSARL